ncbi:MAG: hypothetical protein ACRENU_14180, partial [Gemmatimonadaceae bacterium]
MFARSRLIRSSRTALRRGAPWAAFGMLVSCGALGLVYAGIEQRDARSQAAARTPVVQLQAITDAPSEDDRYRAAIAWGYSERLRLGLESPFRLIEAAARDPRLLRHEQRTVSRTLLGRVLVGRTHEIDPAALDLMGPWLNGRSPAGEQHLALLEAVISHSVNPRAGELAVRLAYALAATERLVTGSGPLLATEAAALVADREIARREAHVVARAARGSDLITVVRNRRARRAFYVERPVLLAPGPDIEREAMQLAESILQSLRRMRPAPTGDTVLVSRSDDGTSSASRLRAAAARVPPSAPLAVTVERYLPLVRAQAPRFTHAVGEARNSEMLVAAASSPADRSERRAMGRLMLAVAIAMRSRAQEEIWFPGDSVGGAAEIAARTGFADVRFDGDVPREWRPYFLRSLEAAVRDARRVLPTLALDQVRVRFQMKAPSDSALAMHDPRTRTLHLPVSTAGGTLMHELAHDLDRQSALDDGLAGYRTDHVARGNAAAGRRSGPTFQALARELSEQASSRSRPDRPAEVFATRVDWFVAQSLAAKGISSGFLSAVQDEFLTGHVVHPARLGMGVESFQSLVNALKAMSGVAAFASAVQNPSALSVVREALDLPLDRRAST